MPLSISPPGTDEYAEFHSGYLAAIAGETDAVEALERQRRTIAALRLLAVEQAGHRYAPDKWSVRQVIGHLADTERVLTYRLLRIARGDTTPLPGFDERVVAAHSNADVRALTDLVDELSAIREATLALVRSLDEAALARRGVVNDWMLSARGLTYITAGHFQHHVNILRDRYGLAV